MSRKYRSRASNNRGALFIHYNPTGIDKAQKALSRFKKAEARALLVRRCEAIVSRVNKWMGRSLSGRDLAKFVGVEYSHNFSSFIVRLRNGIIVNYEWLEKLEEKLPI
jgi:hypothetical protein